MRTGSNLLESKLNIFADLHSVGEAFNPNFIGSPKTQEIMGVSLLDRAQNPAVLLDKIKQPSEILHGFRYFHDRDPRVLLPCLLDPRFAKVILTRNSVESYISWKIARQTGQWKLQKYHAPQRSPKSPLRCQRIFGIFHADSELQALFGRSAANHQTVSFLPQLRGSTKSGCDQRHCKIPWQHWRARNRQSEAFAAKPNRLIG